MSRHAFNKAKSIIEQEYRSPLTIVGLAERLGVNAADLNRLFKKYTGASTARYLAEVRVEAAGEMLIAGYPSNQVSSACGFNSPAMFSLQFRQVTGIYASHYRFQMVGWKFGAEAVARRAAYAVARG